MAADRHRARSGPCSSPRGVLVAGASTHPGKFGFVSLHNILACGYAGQGVRHQPRRGRGARRAARWPTSTTCPTARSTWSSCARPAAANPDLLRACAKKGITAAFIASAGYGEAGEEGLAAQAELVALADELGILLAGPNGQGVVSPPARLCAQIVAPYPPAGHIGIASQSGNFVSSFENYAQLTGVGRQPGGVGRQRRRGHRARLPRVLRRRSRDPGGAGLRRERGRRPGLRRAPAGRGRAQAGRGGQGRGHRRRPAGRGQPHRRAGQRRPGVRRRGPPGRRVPGRHGRGGLRGGRHLRHPAAAPGQPGGGRDHAWAAGAWSPPTPSPAPTWSWRRCPTTCMAAIDGLLPPRWSRNNPIDMAGGETRDTVPEILRLAAAHPDVDAVIFLGMGIQSNQAKLMREGPFWPDHGLERIVGYHERQDARYAEAAAEVSDATGKPVLVATELAVTSPDNPGPAAVRAGGPALLPVGQPGGHRPRPPVAALALAGPPRPGVTDATTAAPTVARRPAADAAVSAGRARGRASRSARRPAEPARAGADRRLAPGGAGRGRRWSPPGSAPPALGRQPRARQPTAVGADRAGPRRCCRPAGSPEVIAAPVADRRLAADLAGLAGAPRPPTPAWWWRPRAATSFGHNPAAAGDRRLDPEAADRHRPAAGPRARRHVRDRARWRPPRPRGRGGGRRPVRGGRGRRRPRHARLAARSAPAPGPGSSTTSTPWPPPSPPPASPRSQGSVVGDGSRYDDQRYQPSLAPRLIDQDQVGPIGGLMVNDGFAAFSPERSLRRPRCPAADPAADAARVLTERLAAHGRRGGRRAPGRRGRPTGAAAVATLDSPPLRQIVAEMLTNSDNETAEAAHQGDRRRHLRRRARWAAGAAGLTELLADGGRAGGRGAGGRRQRA